MTLAKLYEEHAQGSQAEFGKLLLNGLREHIDRIAEICKVVHDLRPDSVLDIPCGNGLITSLVSLYLDGPTNVVGVDISETNVKVAREVFGVNAVQSDVMNFRATSKFDLVMCFELLEHVGNPHSYVNRLCQLSKKWILISVPLEAQPVDGTFHVAKRSPTDVWEYLIGAGAQVKRMWTLPSAFCEKPKWLGWIFALAEVSHV